MKGLLRIIVLPVAVMMVLCSMISCIEKEDYGYPSTINVLAEGDSLSFVGDSKYVGYIITVELLNYDGDGGKTMYSEEHGTATVTTEWLTVKLNIAENKMELYAEPNTTKKKRKLYLYLYSGPGCQEITVKQGK